MPELNIGPIHVKYGDKMDIKLTDIPLLFHKIPGATEILDEVFQSGLNKYQLYNKLVKRDSALNTAINKMAILVERAYQGVSYHPGKSLEDSEQTLLKAAQKKARELKFDQRFYTVARRLMIDGDVVIVKDLPNNRLNFMPMELMTALNSLDQIATPPVTVSTEVVYSGPPGVYIFNEGAGSTGWKTWKPDEILHVALNNDAEMVVDNLDRTTWAMWSQSPLEALRPVVFWRLSTMINDMIWRKLYLPREHHELDLTDVLDPGQYEGDTTTERRKKALAAANQAILDYITKLKNQMPDQGYVTPKAGEVSGVTISVVEPKSTTYVDPNNLLKQLAQGIGDAYFVKSISETKESFAAELVAASIEQLMAEWLAEVVKLALLDLLREALGHPAGEEDLDIKLQLILPKDIETLTREVAVLASANIYTIDEMREVLGMDPLTEEDRTKLETEITMRKGSPGGAVVGPNDNTADETAAQIQRQNPASKDKFGTPQSQHANQKT